MRCAAVVPAAGSGQRLGGRDKALLPLAGRPALAWVLQALVNSGAIDRIVIVASERNQAALNSLAETFRCTLPLEVTLGGVERAISVRAGIERLPSDTELVLVHDAARPLVTAELIRRAVAAGQRYGAAVAAVPVVDTIKQVSVEGRVVHTPERSSLVIAQTPQVFRVDWLREAYRQLGTLPVTDEATLLERAGFPVHVFPGEPENLKLTRPFDLLVAEIVLSRRHAE